MIRDHLGHVEGTPSGGAPVPGSFGFKVEQHGALVATSMASLSVGGQSAARVGGGQAHVAATGNGRGEAPTSA